MQVEIDRTLKRIEEGIAEFDAVLSRVTAAETQVLKTKYEEELKKGASHFFFLSPALLGKRRDKCREISSSPILALAGGGWLPERASRPISLVACAACAHLACQSL